MRASTAGWLNTGWGPWLNVDNPRWPNLSSRARRAGVVSGPSSLALGLLLGTVVYGLHHPRPIEPGKAPDFNALIYTLDLLLPIIDFGQEKAFNPHGGYQWLAYVLIATGWILATTVVAGINRALSRQ
jgi:hypothetical protein